MIVVYDGHEYREDDGQILDSAGERLGTVELDPVCQEYWRVEPADPALDGWQIHINEPDARNTAIRSLIASQYG